MGGTSEIVRIYVDGGARGNPGPAAAGILIESTQDGSILYEAGLFLGKATKAVKNFMEGGKGYECEMTLGIQTDTLDASGKVIETKAVEGPVSRDLIEAMFKRFTGDIEQIPPMVSAIHHKGKRLYELARDGITVPRQPRPVSIKELRLLGIEDGPNPRIKFYCRCSKGTYMRSLVSDMGTALGCGAHLSALRRVYSEPFSIDQAHTIRSIEDLTQAGKLDSIILDPVELLKA